MRDAMISTTVGHIGLLLFVALEGSGILCLNRMLKFDI
jgi:Flp pilus assembly protein TadB